MQYALVYLHQDLDRNYRFLKSLINKIILFTLICMLEKCAMTRYDIKMELFGYQDGISYFFPKSEMQDFKGQQFIYAYYVNTDVSYYQEIPVLSFWGFLSSAGGSIGLFLGFSCYSIMFSFTNFIKSKFQNTVVTQ